MQPHAWRNRLMPGGYDKVIDTFPGLSRTATRRPRQFGLLIAAIGVGASFGPLILQRAVDDVRRPVFLFGPEHAGRADPGTVGSLGPKPAYARSLDSTLKHLAVLLPHRPRRGGALHGHQISRATRPRARRPKAHQGVRVGPIQAAARPRLRRRLLAGRVVRRAVRDIRVRRVRAIVAVGNLRVRVGGHSVLATYVRCAGG